MGRVVIAGSPQGRVMDAVATIRTPAPKRSPPATIFGESYVLRAVRRCTRHAPQVPASGFASCFPFTFGTGGNRRRRSRRLIGSETRTGDRRSRGSFPVPGVSN